MEIATNHVEEKIIEIRNQEEWDGVRSQFATSPRPLGGGKVRAPKAFTERGLYMLATILKSSQATDTTLAVVKFKYSVKKKGK